jgi:hypothetical protein
VNLNIASTMNFGDDNALRHFFLDHYMVHLDTARAVSAKQGTAYGTIGLQDTLAEDAWIALMREETQVTADALHNWLILHNSIHQGTDAVITPGGLDAPDLSVVNFAKQDQFYDWMYVHQELHNFEQQALGLT